MTRKNHLAIRPFESRDEYARMVDYFLDADTSFLEGMGVDVSKLPSRDEWIEAALLDHHRADDEKERAYLAWIYDGELVGHSSINRIKVGEEATIHLHLWRSDLRMAGLGTRFFEASTKEFMRLYRLDRIYCEPFAENPAPNRVVEKLGFRFLKRYRTVPGPINLEQDVNLYVLED